MGLRVQMTNDSVGATYAPIEFLNKSHVTLNGDAATIIFGDNDSNQINNTETASGMEELVVNGRVGHDTIGIGSVLVPTTVFGSFDSDDIFVGAFVLSCQSRILGCQSGFTLASIDAPLSIDGGSGSNTLNIFATFPSGALSGELSNQLVTGLGTTDGISYSSIQTLNLTLGPSADTLLVRSSPSATTNIAMGAGSDLVRLGSAGTGTASGSGNVNAILGLSIAGGPDNDTLVIDDSGDTAANTATITSAAVSGLGMGGGGAAYSEVETITLHLGSGADTVLVRSLDTGRSLTINGNSGADFVRFGSAGTGTTAGNGTVNSIDGQISVSGGAGSDSLFFDDTGDTANNSGTVNTGDVSGFGMLGGVFFSSITSLSVFTGSGNDTVTNNVPAGQAPTVTVNLGPGENGIIVQGTDRADVINVGWDFIAEDGAVCTSAEAAADLCPHHEVAVITINGQEFRTEYIEGDTIFVFAGNGDDIVTAGLVAGQHWTMEFHGENGNDTLRGGAKSDRLVGGRGNDEIEGLDGDDTLLGEAGADSISGGSGNDFIDGGTGRDSLSGGDGRDVFVVGRGDNDRIDFDADDLILDDLLRSLVRTRQAGRRVIPRAAFQTA
jgi:RTX calcium-binding nonapeptide repeat (4 copies)